jgi:hypothetical protein
VPREYSVGRDLPPSIPLPYWSTLITSMFCGGWMPGRQHAYFVDFRRQYRRAMGARFPVFIFAASPRAAHIAFSGSTIRASARWQSAACWVPPALPKTAFGAHRGASSVPAIVVLGFWIVIQLISQVGSIAQTWRRRCRVNIGGFVTGLVLSLFTAGRPAVA